MSDQSRLGDQNRIRSAGKVRRLSLDDLGIPLTDESESRAEKLLEAAEEVAPNTVGDGPDRGAAVMTAGGAIYAAARIETPDQRQTSHELELAVKMALSDGAGRIIEATVVSAEEPVSVCGDCRELVASFANEDAVIHGVVDGDEVFAATIGELLPDEL
jgi:cytidine deaminase